ncbi:hypothetical protein ABH926_003396 [Catenulispora sp. GP43]|uniref:DUF5709 domain-containing protein n=1 Tax=Catenulispora sp. GP43 TaxID=3156263 RepID=UPI00351558B0
MSTGPVEPTGPVDPEAYNAAEDLDQLEADDSQVGGGDPGDPGYSPPERPLGMRTELTFGDRLEEEEPDPDTDADWDGIGDTRDTDGELMDDQVGDERAGRLVSPDEDRAVEAEPDMVARDVGIDGAAASAEEAAMHVVDVEERP